jgi:hypothetical protein
VEVVLMLVLDPFELFISIDVVDVVIVVVDNCCLPVVVLLMCLLDVGVLVKTVVHYEVYLEEDELMKRRQPLFI